MRHAFLYSLKTFSLPLKIDRTVPILVEFHTFNVWSPTSWFPTKIVTDSKLFIPLNFLHNTKQIVTQGWELGLQKCSFFGLTSSKLKNHFNLRVLRVWFFQGSFCILTLCSIIALNDLFKHDELNLEIVPLFHWDGLQQRKNINLLSLTNVMQNSSRLTKVSRFGKSELVTPTLLIYKKCSFKERSTTTLNIWLKMKYFS